MRILSLTTLAFIGLAGAAYAAEQIPDRARDSSSGGVVWSGQLEAKAEQPCYDREQRKKEDNRGDSPNLEGEAAGLQNAGPTTSGSDHQRQADGEQRDSTSVGNNAKDDDARYRDGDHTKREKQEDDSE